MLGCYFTAVGKTFDVEAFRARSPFEPNVVYRRGQLKGQTASAFAFSGFSITLNSTFGKLRPQLRAAGAFLRNYRVELNRLARFPGVTDMKLVFTYCPGTSANTCEYLPPLLLELAGRLGIGIELSVWPGEYQANPAALKRYLKRHRGNARVGG
jgi:hypothetical protein